MGKSARSKQARRQIRIRQNTDSYINNKDWLGLAKHFEKYGEHLLDKDMKPIKFENIEDHAEYLEKQFTEPVKVNQGIFERLKRSIFNN